MGMLLALAIPALLMLLPMRLSLLLTHAARTQGTLGIGAGPLRLSFPFRVARDARGGHQLIFLPRRPREKPRPASRRACSGAWPCWEPSCGRTRRAGFSSGTPGSWI